MSAYCKYYKQKKQETYDWGVTWTDVYPEEYRKGELYSQQSDNCNQGDNTNYFTVYKKGAADVDVNISLWNSSGSEYNKWYSYQYKINDGEWIQQYTNSNNYSITLRNNDILKIRAFKWRTPPDFLPDGVHLGIMTSNGSIGVSGDVSTLSTSYFDQMSGNSIPLPKLFVLSATELVEVNNLDLSYMNNQYYGWDGMFSGCGNLSSVTISNGVSKIANSAFTNCVRITEFNIPDSVISIGGHAFEGCTGLTNMVIPNSVTSIGDYAFNGCSGLTSVTIGSGVTSIGQWCFQNCKSLTSITIPDSVTYISYQAFLYCSGLTSVTIGSGISHISRQAFGTCTSLRSITINATTPPSLDEYVFQKTNNCPIYVPAQSVDAYKSASGWSTYASRIQAIP